MLSIETETRLAKLFLAIAEGERNVEISRQIWSDNYDFDGYQIFKVLDAEGKNRVDTCNFIDFLRSKGVYCTEQEVQLLILFYDQDADGSLSYWELLKLIRSDKAIHRNNSKSNGPLSFNVDYSLGKLLRREVEISKNIISLLHDIRARYDFNIHHLYHAVKGYNAINRESIQSFWERIGISYRENDIKAIVKRLDFNCDGRIDWNEFHTFLGFPTCLRCCQCTTYCDDCCCCTLTHSPRHCHGSPRKTCSPLRCSPRCSPLRCSPRRCSPHCSPLRCSPRRCSPHCSTKQENDLRNSNQFSMSTIYQTRRNDEMSNSGYNLRQSFSPEVKKISPNLSLRLSPERRFSPNRTGNMNCSFRNSPRNSPRNMNTSCYETNLNQKCNDNFVKRQFIDYLKTVMEAEAKLELQKIDLALRGDFNVEDAFRVFELNGRGFITEDDWKYGLNLLEVYPTSADLRWLMKRFDWQKNGRMNYGHFFDMVTPFEKDYRTMVENRPPNSCCTCRCPDIFMFSTKLYLKNMFNSIIDYENKINILKKGYSSLRYKWRDLFRELDTIGFGYFKECDLSMFLKKNYAFTTIKDSDWLFIRLDRNRDGKVYLNEIEDEMSICY